MFAACQDREPNHSANPSATVAAVPANPSPNETPDADSPIPDAKLAAAIEEALAGDPVLHAQSVQVSVVSGEVTLRGTVSTLVAERRAGELVGTFKGASSLFNALVAGGPARPDLLIGVRAFRGIATYRTAVQPRGARGRKRLTPGESDRQRGRAVALSRRAVD